MFIVAASINTHQSTTNGSFVAGLGCDGDLDTFSLTNNGENQWWSTTLTKTSAFTWVYIRIKTGIYSYTLHYVILSLSTRHVLTNFYLQIEKNVCLFLPL